MSDAVELATDCREAGFIITKSSATTATAAPACGSAPVATTSAWLKFDGRAPHPLSMENGG
jgi:hypothetical protein